MNKYLLYSIFIFLFTSEISAQQNNQQAWDSVIKNDKSVVECKVLKVTDNNVEVDPKGDIPFLIIPRTDISSIVYSDGTLVSFETSEKKSEDKIGSFTDPRDGKIYKTVKIGEQIWMAENLNYYTSSGSWCYDNKSSNCDKYGKLYDWETAKRVAPPGWHLPSFEEFESLINNLGGSGSTAYLKIIQGGSSEFEALFGGYSIFVGFTWGFDRMNREAYIWSSSKNDRDHPWYLQVYGYEKIARMTTIYEGNKGWGLSVRCIKD